MRLNEAISQMISLFFLGGNKLPLAIVFHVHFAGIFGMNLRSYLEEHVVHSLKANL